MVIKDPKQSPKISPTISYRQTLNQSKNSLNSEKNDGSMLSPRFKSVAAMAGWDEESLLLASLVVEDTPDRNSKHKKRSDLQFKTPPSNSRRKRRAQRQSAVSIPVTVFNLDEDESTSNNEGVDEKKAESDNVQNNLPKKAEVEEKPEPNGSNSCASSSSALPCMDRLREELSCAICLEICFEPSTTPCGHSFCKKCLRSAADKCGKRCPKCRQLISNGRACTVNTVLWNTIQLLFPEEVQARKEAGALNSREAERESYEISSTSNSNGHFSRRIRPEGSRRAEPITFRSRRAVPGQDEDAAMALRLQREEFMEIYRGRSSLARDNLRAMAQRAINNRIRARAV